MGDAGPFKPYGVCPFEYKCAYGSNGTSQHGFACPDHARLHALIDHKVTFTQINKEKGRFRGEYEEGCCVTQRYFPPTLEDLKMIPLEQQQIIEYCDTCWQNNILVLALNSDNKKRHSRLKDSVGKHGFSSTLESAICFLQTSGRPFPEFKFIDDVLTAEQFLKQNARSETNKKNRSAKRNATDAGIGSGSVPPTAFPRYQMAPTASCFTPSAFGCTSPDVTISDANQSTGSGARCSAGGKNACPLEAIESEADSLFRSAEEHAEEAMTMEDGTRRAKIAEAIRRREGWTAAAEPNKHHDSLQDLSQDLSAIADFFSEQYYDGQDHDVPMLDKMKRVVYMINHIGPSSNKTMLQKELVPDVTSLVSFMRDSARGRAEQVQNTPQYTTVSQTLEKATLAEQHHMAVGVIIGDLQTDLESALSKVKEMHEAANTKQRDQDEVIHTHHEYLKGWLTQDTAPFQSANDVLVHIGKRLEMDLAVSYHSWPSSQSLPAITRPVLPKDVTSYVTQLEGISDTVAKSLEAATASFKNPISSKSSKSSKHLRVYEHRALSLIPSFPRDHGKPLPVGKTTLCPYGVLSSILQAKGCPSIQ